MLCKKGWCATFYYNTLINIIGTLLEEGCLDVAIKPILQQVTKYNLVLSTTNRSSGVRLDVTARSLWITSQKAFSDVKVFDPNISIIIEF